MIFGIEEIDRVGFEITRLDVKRSLSPIGASLTEPDPGYVAGVCLLSSL